VFTTLLYVLEATMRGPGSSRVRLKPDSRYHVVPTSTGPRRDPPYRNFVLRGEPQAHGDSKGLFAPMASYQPAGLP